MRGGARPGEDEGGVGQRDRSTFLYPSLPSVCLPLWSLLRPDGLEVLVGEGLTGACSCTNRVARGRRMASVSPLVSYPPRQAGGLACLCSSDIGRHLNSPVRREHNAPGRS